MYINGFTHIAKHGSAFLLIFIENNVNFNNDNQNLIEYSKKKTERENSRTNRRMTTDQWRHDFNTWHVNATCKRLTKTNARKSIKNDQKRQKSNGFSICTLTETGGWLSTVNWELSFWQLEKIHNETRQYKMNWNFFQTLKGFIKKSVQ